MGEPGSERATGGERSAADHESAALSSMSEAAGLAADGEDDLLAPRVQGGDVGRSFGRQEPGFGKFGFQRRALVGAQARTPGRVQAGDAPHNGARRCVRRGEGLRNGHALRGRKVTAARRAAHRQVNWSGGSP